MDFIGETNAYVYFPLDIIAKIYQGNDWEKHPFIIALIMSEKQIPHIQVVLQRGVHNWFERIVGKYEPVIRNK